MLDTAAEIRERMTVPQAEFVPLQIGEGTPTPAISDIQIEVRRGTATIRIRCPGSAATDCAVWLQG
ncbi:putative transposase (plasmid) [Ralstonia solanacearum CMR15]|nr:putative transposase [Ralstonia solanacearum CMR15]